MKRDGSDGIVAGHGRAARIAAVAALLAAAVAALILLAGGGDGYRVSARFESASQIVGGEVVTLAGQQVGTVTDVRLAGDGEAVITFSVDDPYAPLRQGTRATIVSFSLSGVANRQIELTPPSPSTSVGVISDGGTIGRSDTVSEVDLDAVFNTLDNRTVGDLKHVIKGFERSYEGVGKRANRGYRYLNPLLSSSRRVIGELTRNRGDLEQAIAETSRLSGALSERSADISALIGHANRAFSAIGSERTALAEAISRMPGFMREFNTTAVNLRAALDDLDPLVDASPPAVRELRPFFAEFRGAAAGLEPTVKRLSRIVRRPGEPNDLVELTRSLGPLRKIAVGPLKRNGAERPGALPASVDALDQSLPILSFFRPYTPELLSWFDDFGHSGITDANGGIGRISANFNTFSASTAVPGFPQIFGTPDSPAQQIGLLSINNRQRCPGSQERDPGDGSIPFTDGGAIDCNTSEKAVGP